jgi:hypothetical protein
MTSIYINHADQGDIPAVLRQLASDIESGSFVDDVHECVIVLGIDHALYIGYSGPGETGPSAHLLLCKGAAKIAGAK